MQGRLSAAFLSAMGLCMIRIQEILDKVAANNNDADLELIQKAYVFAATAHAGQTRLSGEPYLSHPLAVADTLAEMGFDEPTVVAGLLHDTVEDTKATLEEIEENFGEEVADIVDGVTKISKISFENKEEAQAENIRKMILAMSHDMRVLMVKLADRLHNMRTLDFQKAYKQKRIAQETMDIYAPLANRLGLYIMKRNLEDLSFKYLRPDIYNQIDHWLDKHQVVEKQIIEKVVALIKDLLAANDIIGHLQKNAVPIADPGRNARHYGFSRVGQGHQGLLRRAGAGAFSVAARARTLQRLYLHAQSQWLPEPAHHGHWPRRRTY